MDESETFQDRLILDNGRYMALNSFDSTRSTLSPSAWPTTFHLTRLAILALALVPAVSTAAPAGAGSYMGVGSCSSSNCHGGVAPRAGSKVLQNEYSTWQKHDSHAKAWKSLLNEDSQRIAKHLGIGAPEKDPLCLSCHATYIHDEARQGKVFQLEDGVGCESCHGAAENWLGPHAARDSSHERNISLGMKELAAPDKQASLCLSCHFGDDNKFVNHRLIGAGHPRLSFELDTFQAILPRHWDVDNDYRERKGVGYEPTRAWMLGHLAQAEDTLDRILSDKRSHEGPFPEFVMFGCASCHHSLTEEQWKKREYGGQPGIPRLNLSSLVVLREALAVSNPGAEQALAGQMERLHKSFAGGGSAPREAVASLKKTLAGTVRSALPTEIDEGLTRRLLARLVRYGAQTPHLSYEDAEQVAMAASVFTNSIQPDGTLYKSEIEALYAALKEPRAFDADQFTAAAQNFAGRLGR